MSKTSITAVVNNLMEITNRQLDMNGTISVSNAWMRYSMLHGLSLGRDFIVDVWRQKGLEIVDDTQLGVCAIRGA